MRSGRLKEVIQIERQNGETLSEAGTPKPIWDLLCTLRAEKVEQTSTEYIRNYGTLEEEVLIFRARFFEGITNADRVLWQGEKFNIKQLTPIGRRKGVELRCVRFTP